MTKEVAPITGGCLRGQARYAFMTAMTWAEANRRFASASRA